MGIGNAVKTPPGVTLAILVKPAPVHKLPSGPSARPRGRPTGLGNSVTMPDVGCGKLIPTAAPPPSITGCIVRVTLGLLPLATVAMTGALVNVAGDAPASPHAVAEALAWNVSIPRGSPASV